MELERDLKNSPEAEETLNLQKQVDQEKRRDALVKRISEAYAMFFPDRRLTVSEWAAEKRFLSSEETPNPGMWDNDLVPYLREIMDSFNKDHVERIIFLKPTQIGGTEAGINILGYVIDQQPQRVLYVLPDDGIISEFSADRLQKVLRNNKCFEKKFYDTDSKNAMLRFTGGFCKFGSANSPSDLASLSVATVIMDEIDKYPKKSGNEADPLSLAEERTKNWPGRKKMFFWSTPTVKSGYIWQAWENADIQYEYRVPCPKCGEYQPFEWSQVKFEAHQGPGEAEKTAHYECKHCKAKITDADKADMLKAGKWFPLNEYNGTPRSIAYKLNSLYSPWVTFGRMAAQFLRSKDNPLQLQNFVNSWLGEAWEQKSAVMDVDIVSQHRTECPMFKLPGWAQVLTGGVDVQKDHLYWSIRAWGAGGRSQVVGYGRVLRFDEIRKVMDTVYPYEDATKHGMMVSVYGVDTGYRTGEVYEHCWANPWRAVPVKGSSTRMDATMKASNINPRLPGQKPLQLWTVNTDYFKNEIFNRLERPVEDGGWMLNVDCSREYCEHLTAEHRIIDDKGYEHWEKKTSAKQNHWFDCEVYSFAVGTLVSVLTLQEKVEPQWEAGSGGDMAYIPEPNFRL